MYFCNGKDRVKVFGGTEMAKFLSIEVEASQLRVAEVEENGKKNRIRHCFCIHVPQGSVEDGQLRDTRRLAEILKKELAEKGIRTKKVFFVVGSTRIASREVRIPLVKKSRIQSIIEANATDYFPIDISKYILSYSIIDIEGEKKNSKKKKDQEPEQVSKEKPAQYHLMVYAAPRSISTAYGEFAENAGLVMTGINYTGDSIYHSVKGAFSKGLHLLMKVELDFTSITIIRDGELALQRNINYGMDSAVEAVRAFPVFGDRLDADEALEVLFERKCIYDALDVNESEEYLHDATTGDEQQRRLSDARAEVTESLRYMIGNISRIMDYYISRNPGAVFDSIYCCGIGGQIRGVMALLSHELGQEVHRIRKLENYQLPEKRENEDLFLYVAILAPGRSGVNLMEKRSGKKKKEQESLSGAIVVFAVGAVAGIALTAAGFANRLYQEKNYEHLNRRVTEESSIEDIYNTYTEAEKQYKNYKNMYDRTTTPNESLKSFLEEMEEKMPSDITVETFSSTGTEVNFSMRVSGKPEAADTLMQLRTFESLATVTTTGIDQADDGTVTMTVTCTYKEPAPLDDSSDQQ